MGLANSDFPASEAFDAINQGMIDEPAEKKDAIKKAAAVFAFTLKNKAGKQESWYIDLKNDGTVGKGVAPPSGKADGMYISSLKRVMRNHSPWENKATEGERIESAGNLQSYQIWSRLSIFLSPVNHPSTIRIKNQAHHTFSI